jgi:hypothetical protein
MAIEKHHLPVDGVWRACPECSYDNGWHVLFKRVHGTKMAQMDLQCPGCKKTYDLGLRVEVAPQ